MRARRILIVHNSYSERGGEDEVVSSEVKLLRERGHDVLVYARSNNELASCTPLHAAVNAVWSQGAKAEISALTLKFNPDIVHIHNTFFRISASSYVSVMGRAPVVQTLHNFRFLCPQAMFLRNEEICEDCIGAGTLLGVARGCYRGSRSQSAVVALSALAHRVLGQRNHLISRFIVPSEFCRNKFIAGGFPSARIHVKPNLVMRPEVGLGGICEARAGFLFAGRLAPEKGLRVMVAALRASKLEVAIKVAGSGPEREALAAEPGIELLGNLSRKSLDEKMGGASALIVPSLTYETFGLVVLEAFSCGLPVIASRIGALAELIDDGKDGLLFRPGDSGDLASKLVWAQANPEKLLQMGRNALDKFRRNFSPEQNYAKLMAIYEGVIEAWRPS